MYELKDFVTGEILTYKSLELLRGTAHQNGWAVGFIPDSEEAGFSIDENTDRYFLSPSGSARGLAVAPHGTWARIESQTAYKKGYIKFNDYKTLYWWLLKGEINDENQGSQGDGL